jgi:hypothetical protein
MELTSLHIDETFDINACQKYSLSIQCALDGFSFSVLDNTVGKFIVMGKSLMTAATAFELKNEISTLISSNRVLQQKYRKTNVLYYGRKLTMVPASLYEQEAKDELFAFTYGHQRDELVLEQSLADNKFLLWSMPGVLVKLFKEQFQHVRFFSPLETMLLHAPKLHYDRNLLLIERHHHQLYVLMVNEQSPQLINAFFVKNDADCLYYILSTLKALGTKAPEELLITGDTWQTTELNQLLREYIPRVKTARLPAPYTISYTFLDESETAYLPLLTLALCE